jgi:hypothetical protein
MLQQQFCQQIYDLQEHVMQREFDLLSHILQKSILNAMKGINISTHPLNMVLQQLTKPQPGTGSALLGLGIFISITEPNFEHSSAISSQISINYN